MVEKRIEYPFSQAFFSEPSGCFLFSCLQDVNGPPNAKSRREETQVIFHCTVDEYTVAKQQSSAKVLPFYPFCTAGNTQFQVVYSQLRYINIIHASQN